MLFEKYLKTVDENAQLIGDFTDSLWDNPELGFSEFKSCALFKKILSEHGFTITDNLAGLPTSFKAVYGEGHPAIGVLAEYDALHRLNYQAGKTEPILRTDTENGHGCGHHLFAGGSLGAVLALKEYVKENGGSVTLFGCPAEENGGGKVYMSRAGVFKDTDAIVSWHPEKMFMVRTRPSLANVSVQYTFTGTASHAGGSPERGRSALDAAEIMNVGVNFLREHVPTTWRVHYAFQDAGGIAPNIVQAKAVIRYLIRANDNREVQEFLARVNKCAEGAAHMTETEVTWEVKGADSNLITIPIMQQTGYEAMLDIPIPVPTEEDIAFGKAIQATVKIAEDKKSKEIYPTKVLPPAPPKAHGGSTDTADVSWNCPTLQFHIATWCADTPTHSWQAISQGKCHYAKMATLYASKVVASTAMRLMSDPAKLQQARDEWKAQTVGGYECPLPDYVQPKL